MTAPPDHRRSAPATLRNRVPILDVLGTALPESGTVLEIASGTGEHAIHFARALPALIWQPSDPDPASRASIASWISAEALPNLLPPLDIDVRNRPWPISETAAILCINMVHISPWPATEALLSEASRLLPKGGLLYLYGPYIQPGVETARSNIAFDADLRQRNPQWGLRNLETVEATADASGLMLDEIVPMPANNLSLLFRRK